MPKITQWFIAFTCNLIYSKQNKYGIFVYTILNIQLEIIIKNRMNVILIRVMRFFFVKSRSQVYTTSWPAGDSWRNTEPGVSRNTDRAEHWMR